jgi:four helix bundle protein
LEIAMSGSHKDLVVWKKAMRLVLNRYRYTKFFPREETYGLAAQMRRAAVSIPSNIAAGKGRYSRKELLQFLVDARGSLLELETQIEIARDLGYLDEVGEVELADGASEVGRMLNGMLEHFRTLLASNTHP